MLTQLNYNMWKQPNVGGAVLFMGLLFIVSLIFCVSNLYGFLEQQITIGHAKEKLFSAKQKLHVLADYERLKQAEPVNFKTFKNCKWDEVLTLESLNKALYKIQKQTDVEFLFINTPNFVTQNKCTNGSVSLQLKVLRDYSFFSFLKKLETELSGIVRIVRFELRRDKNIDQQIAKKIKSGEKASLFEGSIDFEIVHEAFS